jgi:signal transduction histidine kinase/ActR/RegA family two-component response regulator
MSLYESLQHITPRRLREGRMPFVFYSGVVLLIVIALIAVLTPQIGSQEGRYAFMGVIALSLLMLNAGVSKQRALTFVCVYAAIHITLAAWFSQGIFSPRINWLYLIPILMIYMVSRRAGWIWTGVVIALQLVMSVLTYLDVLPNNTPLNKTHEIYAFFVYFVTASSLISLTLIYQGFSNKAIAEIKVRNEELETKRQELQAISDIRDQFIASVSHELRTPMNAIMGFNDLLQSSQVGNSKAMEVLQLTQQSGEHLLTVINDVLDYSQFQSGKLGIHPEPFELRKTVSHAMDLFDNRIKSMRLVFQSQIDDGLPAWILADRHRLMQVLVNLLGNAIKFTQQGHVMLRVKQSDQSLMFEVEDTGIGISEDQQAKVFERFSQATVQTQAVYGGNGLGLAISKRLVELMGGEIGVKSQLGHGSVFWFTVPLVPAQDKGPEHVQHPRFTNQQHAWRFLIVDDVAMNRLLLRQILKLEYPHALMTEAEDGLAALQALNNEGFDLVFMDMVMPQMDGIEASKSIRSTEDRQGQRLPILGLSANVNSSDRERFIHAGADDFLLKPYDRQTLVEVTERLLFAAQQPA